MVISDETLQWSSDKNFEWNLQRLEQFFEHHNYATHGATSILLTRTVHITERCMISFNVTHAQL